MARSVLSSSLFLADSWLNVYFSHSSSCSIRMDLQSKGVAAPPGSYRHDCRVPRVYRTVRQASTPVNVEQATIGQQPSTWTANCKNKQCQSPEMTFNRSLTSMLLPSLLEIESMRIQHPQVALCSQCHAMSSLMVGQWQLAEIPWLLSTKMRSLDPISNKMPLRWAVGSFWCMLMPNLFWQECVSSSGMMKA